MLALEIVVAVILLAIGALGARLVVYDNVPQNPRFLYHGLTRRRRGVLVEYPPGVARIAGVALLLYCVGLFLITVNILTTLPAATRRPGAASAAGRSSSACS